MITLGQALRVLGIQRVLIRHRLDEIILATHLLGPMRFVLYLLPWNWVRAPNAPRATRIRLALEDLGPIFVKFGQLLSTRQDLLADDDLALELAKLRDHVAPFPGAEAHAIVERAYGRPPAEVFAEFDETPLASASIAQVHAARLRDGRDVVVKVVRPGIQKIIGRDLGLLYILASLAERYWAEGRRLKPTRIVAEYEKVIFDELDLVREAANCSQLRRNFEGAEEVYVPRIEWDLTKNTVLVMERVTGISIDNLEALRQAGVDLRRLAEAAVRVFFAAVFRDRYFHADMHAGNLFVIPPLGSGPPKIVPVDFGIMGSLSEFDQRYLASNFLAFLKRDYRRVAELHVESGWVPAGTRVDDFEFAIRSVCEPMFERPIADVSFGHLLLRLFQTAQRFHMVILPQLLLLQKTLVNIEGVARQLYPEIDLWQIARPALERWMGERVGVRRLVRAGREGVPMWAERLPGIPGAVIDLLDQAKHGDLRFHVEAEAFHDIRREVRAAGERGVYAILGAAFIVGATLLFGLRVPDQTMLAEAPFGVWVLGSLGLLMVANALRR
jgi:ubiquinone biosynthesis protein